MCKIYGLKIASLHGHSDRSDGFNQISQNVKAAKERNLYGLGITDHGTCSGLVAHSVSCKESGVVPILGSEFYLRLPDYLNERSDNSKSGRYHITVLSQGKLGYDRLIALNNLAHKNMEISRGTKYPIATFDMFKEVAGEGLIILTGCVASVTFHSEITIAYEYINFLTKLVGKDNLYAELQAHVISDTLNSYERPLELAHKFKLKTVWTNDFHAATEKDLPLLEIYTKATKGYSFTAGFIQSPEEMFEQASSIIGEEEAYKAFQGIDEIVNKIETAEIVDFKHHFELPQADDEVATLLAFWDEALEKDLQGCDEQQKAIKVERFNRELNLLKKYDFLPYFAVLIDIMQYAHNYNIKMISRGSASGSYLWYLAGGSQLDPIKHELMFERFLAELRLETGELPDIDIDIAASKRYIVQEYAKRKWGFEPVGTILTFSHSSLVRLIERIMFKVANIKLPSQLVDNASNVDEETPYENADFKKFMESTHVMSFPANWAENLYENLKGARSGYGRHACAVVPLRENMPVPIEQWASELAVAYTESGSDKTLQYCGFAKYDFLSSDTMDTLQLLALLTGVEYPSEIPDDDPCFSLFNKLDVAGIFQFDTPTAKNVLQLMLDNNRKINSIRHLSDLTSLGRPGPLEQGFHITYAQNDAKLDEHPTFIREIFERTGGVLIYQEQVAELFAKVAFDEYNTEAKEYGIVALKSLVPKNQKVAATEKFQKGYKKLHDMFINGGKKYHNLDEQYLEDLFKSLDGFIRYGFNLSHALSYANVSAQQAWYKYHYPQAYWVVLLNNLKNNSSDREKLLRYIVDATVNHNVRVIPPHVNYASTEYILSEDKNSIYAPIDIVVGLGENVMKAIVKEREENGLYTSLADLNNRVKINSTLKKKLYDAGMLDGLPGTLYDLGVLEIRDFAVKGAAWENAKSGTVVSKDKDTIVLDDGTTLFLIEPTTELLLEAKRLKIKPASDIDDILPNTLIKYHALGNDLINYKRVRYTQPVPEKVALDVGIKEALGFALPSDLRNVFLLVEKLEDQRIGYVTDIFETTSKGGSLLLKYQLHTGERLWCVLLDATAKQLLFNKTKVSPDKAKEIKVGDLVRFQLVMNENRKVGEPASFGQVKYYRILA